MEKFKDLCKQFKIEDYNKLKKNSGICLKRNRQICKTKQKTICNECKNEFIITEDCMCPNCDLDCLIYNCPNFNLKNIIVDKYVGGNNYGSWVFADYFSAVCENYHCIIIFCVYHDPNFSHNNKTNIHWKQPTDWCETILIVYDTIEEMNDMFTLLTTSKNTFNLLNNM